MELDICETYRQLDRLIH